MMAQFEDLQRKFSRDFGIEINRKATLDDATVQERALDLLPIFAQRIGMPVEEVRGRLKKIGLDNTLGINGCAKIIDERQTFEVKVSSGLLLFHYKMVKIFVSRMTFVGDANKIVDETRISDEEMLSTIQRLLKTFWEENAAPEHFFKCQDFSLLQLTKSQIELAAYLLHYADMFVVAHELGHILMRVAPNSVKREKLIIQGAEESIVWPILNKHQPQADKTVLEGWMDELNADYIGVSLCKRLAENDIQRMVIHASAMMSLVMCDMLEKYYCRLKGTREYSTHPPSNLRLDVLQTLSEWPAGEDLGTSFRQFSDHIMTSIGRRFGHVIEK